LSVPHDKITEKKGSQMINSVYMTDCSACGGHGVIFFGDNYDYNIEPCECVVADELL